MKKTIHLKKIIPIIWMLIGMALDMWYHLVHGKEMLDSDMASEMILANLLNSERSISGLTSNWYYSTEMRIISVQWPFRIGLILFPHNWHLARTFGTFIIIIVLACVSWLLMHEAGQDELGLWAAALVVFPGGGWYFWLTMFLATYASNLFVSILSVAMIIKVCNNLKQKNILWITVIALLGLFSGMTSIKQTMVFYAPLMVAAVVLYFMEAFDKGMINSKLSFLLLATLGAGSSLIGYLINTHILQKIFAFRDYSERTIEYGGSFLDYLRYYIWSFGFKPDLAIMSPEGMASFLGLFLGIMIIAAGVILTVRFKLLNDGEQIIVAVALASIVFDSFIFSYIGGGDMQYLQCAVPFGYCLLLLAIRILLDRTDKIRFVILNIITIILLLASLGTLYNEFHEPIHQYRAKPGMETVVGALSSRGGTLRESPGSGQPIWLQNCRMEI